MATATGADRVTARPVDRAASPVRCDPPGRRSRTSSPRSLKVIVLIIASVVMLYPFVT